MIKNTYQDCLKEMFGLRRFGIILGLSTIQKILEELGNPHKKYRTIHVAGTNGKGSIASALSTILRTAGYKVGLYTSPHLVRFNERICINGQQIADSDVVHIYNAIKAVHYGEREPTFFEFSTAMAFYEFARQNVDWAVIETGMGGRLDATNIICPEACVISNISLEHQTYLGNTIAKIAGEKAGIIKENTPVVTGIKQKSAAAVLMKVAEEKSAPLYRFRHHFRVRRNKSLVKSSSAGSELPFSMGQQDNIFTYYGIENTWRDISTRLAGNYQVDNAALVLAICEILNQKHTNISLEHIKQGLLKNSWQGRLEVVSQSPFIIVDGAHNLDGAKNLAQFLSERLRLAGQKQKITLIIGILDDKPYVAMLNALIPLASRVIITQAKIGRALPAETLLQTAKQMTSNIRVIPDVAEALKYAAKTADTHEIICVAGSLYVVGEVKEALEKNFLT